MQHGALSSTETTSVVHGLFSREISVLTADDVIQALFSDIPPLAIGVLAFGVFTFFILVKRISLAGSCLYSSALFAFAAALLDISQIILRRRATLDNAGVVSAIIVGQKLGISFSVGLRYLFFWVFVAECPHQELSDSDLGPRVRPKEHSGRWSNWGIIGTLLQWSTLAFVLAIFVLHSVWRLVPQLNGLSAVYMANMALEITASAVLFLKLIMNSYISPVPRRVIKGYICPFFGLACSAGIAIGNLSSFGFCDTMLGRFTQALLVYVLILFLLISAFSSPKSSSLLLSFEAPILPTVDEKLRRQSANNGAIETRPHRTSRFSLTSMRTRRPSRHGSGIERLWDNTQGDSNDDAIASFEGMEGSLPVQIASIGYPASTQTQPDKQNRDSIIPTLPFLSRPTTGFSFSSYYMNEPVMPAAARSRSPASPVYGLNGIVAHKERNVELGSSAQGSVSSLDDLFRQQQKLDESIQTLRLFSTPPVVTNMAPLRTPMESALSFDSAGENHRTDSAFSLSVFPEPPIHIEPIPQPIPQADMRETRASINSASSQQELENGEGTAYDVTSFIAEPMTARTDVTATPQSGLMTSTFKNAILPIPDVQSPDSIFSTAEALSPESAPRTDGVESRLKPLWLTSDYDANSQHILPKRILKSDFKFSGDRKPIGLPAKPRIQISGPRPLLAPEPFNGDFERPRPPPLFSVEPKK